MANTKYSIEEILREFEKEFNCLIPNEKFIIFKLNYGYLKDVKEVEIWDWNNCEWILNKDKRFIDDFIWHPGNYIFWRNNELIRVGRALDNARKRALVYETISDKLKNVVDYLKQDVENTKVILISCKNEKDNHWAAAIEIFMDLKLNPTYKSKRIG